MPLELQMLIAVLLDQLFGDPRWMTHPVKFIGRTAEILEKSVRMEQRFYWEGR